MGQTGMLREWKAQQASAFEVLACLEGMLPWTPAVPLLLQVWSAPPPHSHTCSTQFPGPTAVLYGCLPSTPEAPLWTLQKCQPR